MKRYAMHRGPRHGAHRVQEIHEMQLEEQHAAVGNSNGSHSGSAVSEDLQAERARFRKVCNLTNATISCILQSQATSPMTDST